MPKFKIRQQVPVIEFLPRKLLESLYIDQKRIIHEWGITIPEEAKLFEKKAPLWVKVMFYDWLIREGLSA